MAKSIDDTVAKKPRNGARTIFMSEVRGLIHQVVEGTLSGTELAQIGRKLSYACAVYELYSMRSDPNTALQLCRGVFCIEPLSTCSNSSLVPEIGEVIQHLMYLKEKSPEELDNGLAKHYKDMFFADR